MLLAVLETLRVRQQHANTCPASAGLDGGTVALRRQSHARAAVRLNLFCCVRMQFAVWPRPASFSGCRPDAAVNTRGRSFFHSGGLTERAGGPGEHRLWLGD